MPRRPATVTQADVARAIRAAKQEGWHSVRVRIEKGAAVIEIGEVPDIHIHPTPDEKLEPLEVI